MSFSTASWGSDIFGPNTGTSISDRKGRLPLAKKLPIKYGDTMVIHVTLHNEVTSRHWWGCSFNPKTGMLEFYNVDDIKKKMGY